MISSFHYLISMKKIIYILGILALSLGFAGVAEATHSWGNYHWARTSNPFTLKLGDNVSSAWDNFLVTTASDWSTSTVLDTVKVAGNTSPRTCKATNGRVEVCNERYGNNGWLGIAQIWASGEHITKGIVKMNDTYFNTSKYNTPAWRNLVMCQEVGHTLGLDHQDEVFDNPNLGTCMDYTSNPSDNQHPNTHDYEQLDIIYSHVDAFTTILSSIFTRKGGAQDLDNPTDWGKAVRNDARGNNSMYVRDLPNGDKVFTFVTWAN